MTIYISIGWIKINNDIIKMADLLRMGHKMLNIACPVCNNPIFQNKSGEKYCPSCDRRVVIMDEKSTQNYQEKNLKTQKKLDIGSIALKAPLISLEEEIARKIQWLTNKLDNENDIEEIRKYIEIISNLLDLLAKISSFFG
ncbi:MAG: Sjogren's syndrome/scleroderma autoantigen 1 family protein [Candidatus Thorarchaeota archaeon]